MSTNLFWLACKPGAWSGPRHQDTFVREILVPTSLIPSQDAPKAFEAGLPGTTNLALPFLGAKNFESDVASCEFFGLSEDKRLSQSREPAHFTEFGTQKRKSHKSLLGGRYQVARHLTFSSVLGSSLRARE